MKIKKPYLWLNRSTAVLLLSTLSWSLVFIGGRVFAQSKPAVDVSASVNQSDSLLDRYAVNLTASTASDETDAIAKDFDSEIKEIAAALTRKQPVNPIIVSEDGGSSSSLLVQTLASRIAAGNAPKGLQDKQIYWLDTANLYNGAKNETEIAARWTALLAEVKAGRERNVLFVRELPALFGANAAKSIQSQLEQAIKEGSLRVISEVFDEESFNNSFAANKSLRSFFTLIKSPLSDEASVKDAKTERERKGFVGAKVAPDLEEMIDKGDEKVRVIAQVNNPDSQKLQQLLHNAGAEVVSRMDNFNSMEIEIPARNLSVLSQSRLTNYLAPDRSVENLGHVSKETGLDSILADPATSNLKGSGVGVAILDSGIDKTHSAFKSTAGTSRVVATVDFTGSGTTNDAYGHGTHVASMASGGKTSDGDDRFTGVAQDSSILALKVLDGNGSGKTAWVLKALDWVLSNRTQYNIRVVNMSLGANAVDSYKNDALCRAVRKLVDHGIVVVAAAGNDGKTSSGSGSSNKIYGRIHSPGNEPSAITVGASNTYGTDDRSDDSIASYSSRGPTRSFWTDASSKKHYDNIIKPDIVAPGNKIIGAEAKGDKLSADYPSLKAKNSTDDTQDAMYLSGTSVASPIVAGAVAVMLQANPNLTPNMVKAILHYSAQPLRGFNMFEQGAGQLNLAGAIQVTRFARTDLKAKFLTDLAYNVVSNGYGAAEKDRSNGGAATGDGATISLDTVKYAKGLGVHANSEVTFNLARGYQYFMSDIGIDDEVGANGKVVFQVYVDGVKRFDSGAMVSTTAAKSIKVDVAGANELKLVVTDGGDGNANDHADWAAARLTPYIDPSQNMLAPAYQSYVPYFLATPNPPTTNIGSGASFSWSCGVIFNRTFATGPGLIRALKVYGEGYLLGDGVNEGASTVSINTAMLPTDITLGTQVTTSNGIVMGDGTALTNISNLLGDGIVMGDGITMGDGIVMGDGITMGDGIVMGDSRAMSVYAFGDNTSCMKP